MSFSPDESIILDVQGHKTLWAYPVTSQAPYKVFSFPAPDVRIDYPVWSPDGRWVLFDHVADPSRFVPAHLSLIGDPARPSPRQQDAKFVVEVPALCDRPSNGLIDLRPVIGVN